MYVISSRKGIQKNRIMRIHKWMIVEWRNFKIMLLYVNVLFILCVILFYKIFLLLLFHITINHFIIMLHLYYIDARNCDTNAKQYHCIKNEHYVVFSMVSHFIRHRMPRPLTHNKKFMPFFPYSML